MLRFIARASVAAVLVLGAGAVTGRPASTGPGQAYPKKPLRIVTGNVGGGKFH